MLRSKTLVTYGPAKKKSVLIAPSDAIKTLTAAKVFTPRSISLVPAVLTPTNILPVMSAEQSKAKSSTTAQITAFNLSPAQKTPTTIDLNQAISTKSDSAHQIRGFCSSTTPTSFTTTGESLPIGQNSPEIKKSVPISFGLLPN